MKRSRWILFQKVYPAIVAALMQLSWVCLDSSAIAGGSGGSHQNFPAYEVGDIVIYGEAGTDILHPGHSAILVPREKKSGVWKVQLIDSTLLIRLLPKCESAIIAALC